MTAGTTAVIVGASSGIGEALARELAARGYSLGLTARREDRRRTVADEVPTEAHVAPVDVTVTTVEPGYVDTDLATGAFWLVDVDTAADQMADAIESERRHAYVSRRWRLVAWALKVTPDAVLRRVA